MSANNSDLNLREKQKEETRIAILNAAKMMFLTENFSSVSTQAIADKASELIKTMTNDTSRSVSKASIFNHFNTKEELGFQVLMALFEDVDKEFATLINDDFFKNPIEGLREALTYLLQSLAKNPTTTSMLVELMTELGIFAKDYQFNPYFGLFEKYMNQYIQEFSEVLKQMGIKNSFIRSQLLFGLLDGVGIQVFLFHIQDNEKQINDFVEEIMKIIMFWIDK